MEVFVSEKDKDFIDACLSETNCYLYIQDELQGEILKLKSIDQHDAEVRADERKKDDEYIENRLLTYKNRISFLEEQNKMLLSYVTKLFNSQNTITTTILCDLQQKLADMKGNKFEEVESEN